MAVFGAPPVDGLGNAGGFKGVIEDRGDLGSGEMEMPVPAPEQLQPLAWGQPGGPQGA